MSKGVGAEVEVPYIHSKYTFLSKSLYPGGRSIRMPQGLGAEVEVPYLHIYKANVDIPGRGGAECLRDWVQMSSPPI